MSTLGYALRTIHKSYRTTLLRGADSCLIQLTNDNKGFKADVIELVKERLVGMTFDIPTHISILPNGKKESNETLFDGLEDIYCNSDELKQIVDEMKKQVI